MAELSFRAAIFIISSLLMIILPSIADENLGSNCVYNAFPAPCSSPEINLILDKCNPSGSGNYTHNSSFESNLLSIFSNFTSAAASSKAFYNASSGSGEDQVFGLFYCRGDVDPPGCLSCVQAGVSHLKNCTARDGLAYYEQCTLRYARRDLFNTIELNQANGSCKGFNVEGPGTPDLSLFNRTVATVMLDLTHRVILSGNSSSYFATKSTELYKDQKVYALVQCRPDLAASRCEDCLSKALIQILDNCLSIGQMWGMYFQPGCQMRYDVVPFFNLPSHRSPPPTPVMGLPNSSGSPGRSSAGLWSITSPAIILIISTFNSLIVSFKDVDIFPFL